MTTPIVCGGATGEGCGFPLSSVDEPCPRCFAPVATDQQHPVHEHVYQPNGLVRENAVSYSPVSAMQHWYYVKVFSIAVCACGAVSKIHVANEGGESGAERAQRGRS